jgi:hypothetical protein
VAFIEAKTTNNKPPFFPSQEFESKTRERNNDPEENPREIFQKLFQ